MKDKTSCKNTIMIDRLKKLIDKYTREEIATGIGCDTSLVTKHYNEDRTVTLEYLAKYCAFFHVSADYLLGLTEATTTNKDVQFIVDYTGLSEEAISALRAAEDETETNAFTLMLDHFILSGQFYPVCLYLFFATINAGKLQDHFDECKGIDFSFEEEIDVRKKFNEIRMSLFDTKEYFSRFVDSYFKQSSGFDMEQWRNRLFHSQEKRDDNGND